MFLCVFFKNNFSTFIIFPLVSLIYIIHVGPLGESMLSFFVQTDAKPPIQGMFGTVWRAMDSRSGQWYAVKKSHTYRQATVAREREVTNHVLMNPHPFIVQIFGNHFIESGTGFSSLVMEFCAGGDLQDKVNAGGVMWTDVTWAWEWVLR